MSTLEERAKTILFPHGGRALLRIEDQGALARWFVKTAVVLNTSQNYRLMVPRHARNGLKRGLSLDWGVFLATCRPTDGSLDYAQVSGAFSGVFGPEWDFDEVVAVAERTYVCSVVVGGLVGVVVYAPPGGWARPIVPAQRIFPPLGDLDWVSIPAVESHLDAMVLDLGGIDVLLVDD